MQGHGIDIKEERKEKDREKDRKREIIWCASSRDFTLYIFGMISF